MTFKFGLSEQLLSPAGYIAYQPVLIFTATGSMPSLLRYRQSVVASIKRYRNFKLYRKPDKPFWLSLRK